MGFYVDGNPRQRPSLLSLAPPNLYQYRDLFVGWDGHSIAQHGDTGALYLDVGRGDQFGRPWAEGHVAGAGCFLVPPPFYGAMHPHWLSEYNSGSKNDHQASLVKAAPSFVWFTHNGKGQGRAPHAPTAHFHLTAPRVVAAISMRYRASYHVNFGQKEFTSTISPLTMRDSATSSRVMATNQISTDQINGLALAIKDTHPELAIYLLRELRARYGSPKACFAIHFNPNISSFGLRSLNLVCL